MTRTKKIVAVVLGVLVLSALAFAGVANAKDKDKDDEVSSFTLAAVNQDSLEFDWGSTSIDTLETTEGTPIGGWAGGRCVRVGLVDEHLCDIVMRLPEGDITLTGLVEYESTDPWVFVVTGGTGQFQNARGEVESALYTYEPFVVHFTFRLEGATTDY